VYRSDAPPAPAPPSTARAGPSAAPRAGSAAKEPAGKTRSALGWIETGVGIMAIPLTLTMLAMIAPALWIAGSRPRR